MKKLDFLKLLKSKSKIVLPFLGFLAIINGLWSSSLLLLVNNKISGTPLPFFDEYDWLIYLVLTVSSLLISYNFQAYMLKMTLNFGNEMMLEIFDKLRSANYESYLKLGEERVRTTLEDVGVLGSFPDVFLSFFNSFVMIIVGVSYMFWVYPKGALIILFLIVVLGFVYVKRNAVIEKNIDEARSLNDIFMRNVNDFLLGFKKIKMNTNRSESIFHGHIAKNRHNSIKLLTRAQLGDLGNNLIGDYSFYFGIGIILFVLPLLFNVEQTVLSSFLITILFLMGPISIFVDLMDSFIRFKVAINRINEFAEITETSLFTDKNNDSREFPGFDQLKFSNISYEYLDKNNNPAFKLKPINLKINRGEVVFIYGGNGSGKSTFINMLSGLYVPKSGQVYFNNELVTDDNRAAYRNTMTCIFADDYLFSENYDNFDLLPSNDRLTALLSKMALEGKIQQDIANNKILHDLSSGQQKRLALIYSLIEDKEIFVFDEWAAEQDPEFRAYFYKSIIPDLKRIGKTVIAITHDDAYYKYCDRLIKFDYGKMLEDTPKELIA
ncbi:cyclic peptide export ABC transporter [Maribacter sp. 2-571]|uniref:cyclic peptide export ABC transporter n=1 Tax=Maribacter sp. 2-571 TaxID=3417569 RepID=UPI003D330781